MAQFDLKIAKKERSDGKIQLDVTIPARITGNIIKGATMAMAMSNKISLKDVQEADIISTVIEKVGEPAYNAFINHYAMVSMAPFAVSEKALEIVMEPETESKDQLCANKDFRFVVVVTPKPHYELKSYDPVTVRLPKPVVTEAEIDAQLVALAENNAQSMADDDACVQANSEIVIGIETKHKESGEQNSILTAPKRVYKLGDGFLPAEFDEALIGMKAGESRTFDFNLPGIEGSEPTPVTTTVTLTQVNKRVIPAITDAWVEANIPEAKNVEGLRKMVHEQGTEYKNKEFENQKFFMAASELATRFIGSIPDEIYEHTRANMIQGLTASLQQQGMTIKQYLEQMGMDEQQFSMQLMMQVRESLRQGFALDALARHLKLTINKDDYEDALKRIAPNNVEEARKEYEQSGRTYLINEAALRTKANKWLYDNANFEYIGE
ncbi:MAG: hypothetical protein LBG97_07720 [Coriobacteriales bacterium]|jgi:trigger factor|nr:hypothetical protein [Coriobacteriales bacterium]